ncbi:hypothetical protein AB0D86_10060 [Streptomyces sp. NPDC048324]|uniref:hypothetical protein n=1 Tax=Streptomyces sp. NPDC048324 TaxID=3157205 RepID=UPI0034348AF5
MGAFGAGFGAARDQGPPARAEGGLDVAGARGECRAGFGAVARGQVGALRRVAEQRHSGHRVSPVPGRQRVQGAGPARRR